MTEPDRRLEPVQVIGAYVKGNQWELNIQLSFLKKASKAWVDIVGDEAPPNGTYWCVLVKGDKWSDRQGDADWQYNWNIAEFNVPAPGGTNPEPQAEADFEEPPHIWPDDEPSSSGPAPVQYQDTMKADHPSTRHSYHMQSALKAANKFYSGRENCTADNVVTRAERYLKYFMDHSDDWETSTAPDGKSW
jgi:hypothetical protein